MERGPTALFWAIVAVGIGPAMWLGVRLGAVEVAPSNNPAVVGERTSGPDRLVGGTGAGDSPLDDPAVNATPRGRVLPLTSSASPSPSAATSTSPSPLGTTSATASTEPSTEPPTTAPTESTTTPTTPPTENTTAPTEAPDPPTGGAEDPTDPTGESNLSESGDTGGMAAGSAQH
ncbi:hypothetical protein [Paractinoplanes toevensis]|uniref:Uncharacterized protein n=1 Tax=Paractinoplanes toevensis TaxID=571911 RepID=A0A919WB67_9ACTN|nr:hypothetical protein [Actinoplanes toevensis]GIM97014.1 hypothetical protein Ato02nite_088070 [Actinoplanes toevensis]